MRLEAGSPVSVVMTKWGDRPHWEFSATYLGADGHGDWLGIPAGTHFTRPGADYVSPVDQVTLVPASGWVATFHAAGGQVRLYVDLTTPASWTGASVSCVDLDLDVVELPDGRVYVDDEDEFAEHQVDFGYPGEVVAAATAECHRVHAAVLSRVPPFDLDTCGAWLRLVSR